MKWSHFQIFGMTLIFTQMFLKSESQSAATLDADVKSLATMYFLGCNFANNWSDWIGSWVD